MKEILMAFAVIGITSSILTQNNDSIVGLWYTPDADNAIVEITKNPNGLYNGVVKTADNPNWVNQSILRELKYNAENNTWVGIMYNPRRDMIIDVTLSLNNHDKLKVTGEKFFISKTFYWERRSK